MYLLLWALRQVQNYLKGGLSKWPAVSICERMNITPIVPRKNIQGGSRRFIPTQRHVLGLTFLGAL